MISISEPNKCTITAQDQGLDSFDSFETLQIYCTTKFLHQYYSRLCFRLLWIIARRFIYIPPPSLASFASSDKECSTWKKRKHNHPIVPKKWPSFTYPVQLLHSPYISLQHPWYLLSVRIKIFLKNDRLERKKTLPSQKWPSFTFSSIGP